MYQLEVAKICQYFGGSNMDFVPLSIASKVVYVPMIKDETVQ